MQHAAIVPKVPRGEIRSFGPVGPKYEIGEVVAPLPDDDWLVAITLVESGELATYPLGQLVHDPRAA